MPRFMRSSLVTVQPLTVTIWSPPREGAVRRMQQAMATVEGDIDYINAHGTSTPRVTSRN